MVGSNLCILQSLPVNTVSSEFIISEVCFYFATTMSLLKHSEKEEIAR